MFQKEISEDNASDAAMLEGFDLGPVRSVHQRVAHLSGNDANFLFGPDTPSAPTYGNLPGLNGYLETQELQRAALSLEQIFRAATINNAREFKLDSQLGTIEPGKIANLELRMRSIASSTTWFHLYRRAMRNSMPSHCPRASTRHSSLRSV
jgi:hypothetical protein